MACRDGVNGLITNPQFLEQQLLLGEAYADLIDVEAKVYSGLHLIVLFTDADVEVALLQPYASTLDKVNPNKTANLLRQALEALENHITNTTGQTFNDYLFTNGLKVSQDFAALSGVLGHTINPLNVA